jgi:hypothetical protein
VWLCGSKRLSALFSAVRVTLLKNTAIHGRSLVQLEEHCSLDDEYRGTVPEDPLEVVALASSSLGRTKSWTLTLCKFKRHGLPQRTLIYVELYLW